MALGWRKAGVDIDTLFMGRVNTAIANTGFRYGGVDLAQLLEDRAGTTAIANTNIRKATVDISTLFRDINLPLLVVAITTTQMRVERADGGSPVELYLNADGKVYHRIGASLTTMGNWVSPAANAPLYACRMTVTSGTLSTGSNGVWEALNVTRSWTRTTGAATLSQVNFTMELRRISDSAVVSTVTGGWIICDRE